MVVTAPAKTAPPAGRPPGLSGPVPVGRLRPQTIAAASLARVSRSRTLLMRYMTPKNAAQNAPPAITPRRTGFFSEKRANRQPAASAYSTTESTYSAGIHFVKL